MKTFVDIVNHLLFKARINFARVLVFALALVVLSSGMVQAQIDAIVDKAIEITDNTAYVSKTDQKLLDRLNAMNTRLLSKDTGSSLERKALNLLNTGATDEYLIGRNNSTKLIEELPIIGDAVGLLNPYGTTAEWENSKVVVNKYIAGEEFAKYKAQNNIARNYADTAIRDVLRTPEMMAMADVLAAQYALEKGGNANDYRGEIKDSLYNQLSQLSKQLYQEDSSSLERGINKSAALALMKMKERMVTMVDTFDKAKAEGTNTMDAAKKATEEEMLRLGRFGCATIDELRLKYQSGCWSCVIVEKLVSTFLKVASDAYGLSQDAGLIVLGIGAVMWVLMWGLKNMSSLTQLELGNILNDLIKFLFKVALAYFFIMAGLKAVGNYFVNPIMHTGSTIAQQFWSKGLGNTFEKYISEDYNYEEIDAAFEKSKQEQDKLLGDGKAADKSVSGQLDVDAEAAKKLKTAKDKELEGLPANGSNIQIPTFQMPGAAGTFASPFGCRPAPVTQGNKKGSSIHKGVDVAAGMGSPVYAIGTGKIIYSYSKSGGYMASISHEGVGREWTSIYMHMQPNSADYAVKFNRSANPKGEYANWLKVAQGQQIGFVGNTGNSGGYHLHLAVKYKGDLVDPLNLMNKKVVYAPRNCPIPTTEANRTPAAEGYVRDKTKFPKEGKVIGGSGSVDLSSMYVKESDFKGGSYSTPTFDTVKYTGPTDIMSASVMNSILGATAAITNTVAENMILGDAIQCYAGLEKGGAWHFGDDWKTLWIDTYITNGIMWLEGALIWCTGFLMVLAVAYYLLDICFKIGFAVIALPIVVGLWPFNMTKNKLSACLSIIFKASATFAFLAITTSYSMNLISAGLEGHAVDDGTTISSTTDLGDTSEGGGLSKLYQALDASTLATANTNNEANIKYIADRLAIFSFDFIILIFCFLYSYKLIGATIPQFVNKFFPDNAFGDAQPMHHWATAATKWVKDQAMKPVGLARDIALHQGGKAIKGTIKGAVGGVARAFSGKKGKKDDKPEEDNK